MITKKKAFAVLLAVILLATQVGFAAAKGNASSDTSPSLPVGQSLTPEQMKNSIVVQDGHITSRPQGQGLVYRLANCDAANPDSPCYFMITGSGKLANGSSPIPMSSSATLVCGVNIYSYIGILGARLQQNINVTWWATSGRTPVTMNWGDLGGTATFLPYWSWTNLSGPTPNPGWGVYVSSSGSAYSNASGLLVYAPPPPLSGSSTVYATRLTINSGGWYCS